MFKFFIVLSIFIGLTAQAGIEYSCNYSNQSLKISELKFQVKAPELPVTQDHSIEIKFDAIPWNMFFSFYAPSKVGRPANLVVDMDTVQSRVQVSFPSYNFSYTTGDYNRGTYQTLYCYDSNTYKD
jgi:hypothetical protein